MTKQRDEDGRKGLLVFSIALAFVLLAQVVRTLFPIVYEASEDASIVVAGVGVVAVYLAPILALPIVWLGSRRAATTGVVLLVAARLAVPLVHPIPQLLSMVATAAGLIGVSSIVVSIRDRLDAVTRRWASWPGSLSTRRSVRCYGRGTSRGKLRCPRSSSPSYSLRRRSRQPRCFADPLCRTDDRASDGCGRSART